MSNELKEIITKIVSENPDVKCVYSNWEPNGVGGIIMVHVHDITKYDIFDFIDKYTQYITDMFDTAADDLCSLVLIEQANPLNAPYPTVYNKTKGGFL